MKITLKPTVNDIDSAGKDFVTITVPADLPSDTTLTLTREFIEAALEKMG